MGITLSEISTFTQLLPIVKKAEPNLSLLGNRYVCIGNEDEAVDLTKLVAHTIKLIVKNPEFSESERGKIKQISKLVDRLYKISDEQVKNSNLFTWLANLFREYFSKNIRFMGIYFFSDVRGAWKGYKLDHILTASELYKYYTPNQFEKRFGYVPDKRNENLDFYEGNRITWYRPRKDPSERRVVYTGMHSDESINFEDKSCSTIVLKDPNRIKKSVPFSLSKYVKGLLMME